MRLIDADKLLTDNGMARECANCKTHRCEYEDGYTLADFCGWIDDAPTVDAEIKDAVEVVRCKDCKYSFSKGGRWCLSFSAKVADEDYCSRGAER